MPLSDPTRSVPLGAHAGAYLVFFASGLASLMCEVVWFKQLGLALGSSTLSASVVVACFFGGLALGSLVVGRLSDRWAHPLRAYALLELSLAAVSAGTTLALAHWSTWIVWFRPWMSLESATALPVKVGILLLVLLPPTTLMGATLPVLSRHLVRQRHQLAQRIGLLYGVNTLGASIGCALVGWFLLAAWGALGSALAASAIYALVGLSSGALAVACGPAPPPDDVTEAATSSPSTAATWVLVAVFGASGFVAIGYEVLWFRTLAFFTHHSVHAFTTLLSIYLLGLVLGAVVCATRLAPRKDQLLAAFTQLQLGVAVAAFASFVVLGGSGPLLAAIAGVVPGGEPVAVVVLALGILLVPTTLVGVAFPLAAELTVQRIEELGSRVGLLYALNTFGGVLGSFFVGFVVLPRVGVQRGFELLIALNLLLFVVLVFTQPALRSRRPLLARRAGLAVAGLLVGSWMVGPQHLRRSLSGSTGAVLDFRETEDATFAVVEYALPHSGTWREVRVNGAPWADDGPRRHRSMAALGHLPALLHPDPHEVVVLGVGTGTTAGATSLHDPVRRIWAVDLTRTLFQYAPYFEARNQGYHHSPLVEQVVADGRHFLQVSRQTYDVVTFEPPRGEHLDLYTHEFYALAASRLADGGLLAQWLPLDRVGEPAGRRLTRTVQEVFDHVSLWMPDAERGILVASQHPLRIDLSLLNRRAARPEVAASLAAVGFPSGQDLLATFVTRDEALARWVGDAEALTDDRHTLAPPDGVFLHRTLLSHRVPVQHLVRGSVPDSPALRQGQRVHDLVRESHDLAVTERWREAITRVDQALRVLPRDPWLTWLRSDLEWRSRSARQRTAHLHPLPGAPSQSPPH